ncbi:hypothetical protein ACFFLH_05690 [Balneatrix alpica]|uniref:Uncharacterized protein n=1 Tax=Balneatrix alpica TaxID=75684 RepID=A0ABV5Z9D6_9GAMM
MFSFGPKAKMPDRVSNLAFSKSGCRAGLEPTTFACVYKALSPTCFLPAQKQKCQTALAIWHFLNLVARAGLEPTTFACVYKALSPTCFLPTKKKKCQTALTIWHFLNLVAGAGLEPTTFACVYKALSPSAFFDSNKKRPPYGERFLESGCGGRI